MYVKMKNENLNIFFFKKRNILLFSIRVIQNEKKITFFF